MRATCWCRRDCSSPPKVAVKTLRPDVKRLPGHYRAGDGRSRWPYGFAVLRVCAFATLIFAIPACDGTSEKNPMRRRTNEKSRVYLPLPGSQSRQRWSAAWHIEIRNTRCDKILLSAICSRSNCPILLRADCQKPSLSDKNSYDCACQNKFNNTMC